MTFESDSFEDHAYHEWLMERLMDEYKGSRLQDHLDCRKAPNPGQHLRIRHSVPWESVIGKRKQPSRASSSAGRKRQNAGAAQNPDLIARHRPLFLDIETLGLHSSDPIFLVGLAGINDNRLEVLQLLAPNIEAEQSILSAVMQQIRSCKRLVTYNGKSFDLSRLKSRFSYYGMPKLDSLPLHWDLRYPAKDAFGAILHDTKLQTIGEYLGCETSDEDLPGKHVPKYYTAYLENKNIGPIMPVIEHNRDDMVRLASLLSYLCFKGIVAG